MIKELDFVSATILEIMQEQSEGLTYDDINDELQKRDLDKIGHNNIYRYFKRIEKAGRPISKERKPKHGLLSTQSKIYYKLSKAPTTNSLITNYYIKKYSLKAIRDFTLSNPIDKQSVYRPFIEFVDGKITRHRVLSFEKPIKPNYDRNSATLKAYTIILEPRTSLNITDKFTVTFKKLYEDEYGEPNRNYDTYKKTFYFLDKLKTKPTVQMIIDDVPSKSEELQEIGKNTYIFSHPNTKVGSYFKFKWEWK